MKMVKGESSDQVQGASPMQGLDFLGLQKEEAVALASDLALLVRLHESEPDVLLLSQLAAAPPLAWFHLALVEPVLEETASAGERSAIISTEAKNEAANNTLKGDEGAAEAALLLTEVLAPFVELKGAKEASLQAELDELAAEYATIYLTYGYKAAPAESVWRDEEHLERQQAMFMVRDWYQHYHIKVPDWRKCSDDHIIHELQFLGFLLEKSENPIILRDAARFLRDHPLVWVPEFAKLVIQRSRSDFYIGLHLLTIVYLRRLARFLGEMTGEKMISPPLLLASDVKVAAPKVPSCGDAPSEGGNNNSHHPRVTRGEGKTPPREVL